MSADLHVNRLHLRSPQRRRLLKAAGATGLLAAVERNFALAQTAPDYKALVCIYLQGGNDGENTLIRYDSAGYNRYASVRPPVSGLNIPQSHLQPIQPAGLATPFGFHPACAPLKHLFDQKQLAVVANVGVLAQPSTKLGIGGAVRGGDFYGTLPTQALNGPDDLGDAGRWIPTTSIEQYGATLCRWFGIAESDLPYVFPNMGAFANTNLGFMG